MVNKSPVKLAPEIAAILRFFNESKKRVFQLQDLSKILVENRDAWKLAADMILEKFLELLYTQALQAFLSWNQSPLASLAGEILAVRGYGR